MKFMRKPGIRTPLCIFLAILILLAPVSQQQAKAEPVTLSLSTLILLSAGVFAAIEGGKYIASCYIFGGGDFDWYDFAGYVAAGALQGVARVLILYFPPAVLTEVLGCAATVPGIASALGPIIGDFFRECVSWVTSIWDVIFGDIESSITSNAAEFNNRFQPTLDALCNANGGVPITTVFNSIWADFSSTTIETSNVNISTAGMEYNSSGGTSWRMLNPGSSYLQATFSLSQVPAGVILCLSHLSSADAGAPGGGYSPVDIYINGDLFLDNYDVAQNHCGSHGYETDQWQIAQYLTTGQNTITITFEDDPWAYTHYWIQSLAVSCGSLGGSIPSYTVTASSISHGAIMPSENICLTSGNSKTFYATADFGYVVDKWYVNGQVAAGSDGQTSFTVSNIQQDTTILVTFKQAPQPASLNIIAPTAGDYARGYRTYIGWQTTGLTGNVKIELFQNGALYYVIEDSVSATIGKYTWNMPYDIPVEDNYTIKISSLSSSTAAESQAFSIVDVSQSVAPIEIHNISELQVVSSDQVINGRLYSPTAHYVLDANIDASSVTNFVPIGTGGDHYRFSGIFDGQNHKIMNLKIDRTDEVVGLFKVLMDDGTIKNLILEDGSIRAKGKVGALIGECAGTVINCHSSARVRTIDLTPYYVPTSIRELSTFCSMYC